MKKWIMIMLLMMAIVILIVWKKATTPTDVIAMYEEKWGIQLPAPHNREELWSSETFFGGDGEWANAFYYDRKLNLASSGMQAVTTYNMNWVNSQISHFVEQTISLYRNEEKTNKIVQLHKEAQIGDYYFYKSESHENDYFIALYKIDEQTLYTFEWHQ